MENTDVPQVLRVWIPTNRRYADGRPKAMDGLNELIEQNRTHRNVGARIERENVEWCAWHIRQAMLRQHWTPMLTRLCAAPCTVDITFVEVHDRRDVPNVVGGGMKYALDALTRPQGKKIGAAAIYDDSVKWLTECTPHIRVNPERPGIEIVVTRGGGK